MSEPIDTVNCPALSKQIDFGYCQELQMATDEAIIWVGLEDRFSDDQMQKCKNCPKRTNPSD